MLCGGALAILGTPFSQRYKCLLCSHLNYVFSMAYGARPRRNGEIGGLIEVAAAPSPRESPSPSRLMPLARADVVPKADVGRFPLRIGAVLLAPRFGLPIVLRGVDDRIPVAAGERRSARDNRPNQSLFRCVVMPRSWHSDGVTGMKSE